MTPSRLGATAALVLTVLAGCGGGDNDSPATDAPGDGMSPSGEAAGQGDPDGAPARSDGNAPTGVSPFDVASGADETDVPGDAAPDNGPEGQAPVGTGGDTAAIAGIWDYTRDVPEGTDVAFFAISETGTVTEYDYQADDVGDGSDCHITFAASIASNGDDRYDIQDASSLPGAASIDDVRISVENGSIVFRYLGDAFDPEFGEGMAGITETYPAAGVSPTDLALCSSPPLP